MSETIGLLIAHAVALAALATYECAKHAPDLVCTLLFVMSVLQAWHAVQLWLSPDFED